jgi:hypothetical protein
MQIYHLATSVYFVATLNILQPFGIFYASYILWPFGTSLPVLVSCSKKDLAALPQRGAGSHELTPCHIITVNHCQNAK